MRYNLTIQDIRNLVSKVRSAVKPEVFVKDLSEMFELFFRKNDERDDEIERKLKSLDVDLKNLEKRLERRISYCETRIERIENKSRN